MSSRIGVDIGGTFTDFILYDEIGNTVTIDKITTTPDSPERAVIDVIKKNLTKDELGKIDFFLHGTTVGLNSLLERKGSKVGLICTKGFRDVLEIRRGDRDEMYNLFWQPPPPLVPRFLRLEIEERLFADGTVHIPINVDQIKDACNFFIQEGVNSIAVAFINSYTNKKHEVMVEKELRKLDFKGHISLSSMVSGEYREYERTTTTVIDAFVKTRMSNYLNNLNSQMAFGAQALQPFVGRQAWGTPDSRMNVTLRTRSGHEGLEIDLYDMTYDNQAFEIDPGHWNELVLKFGWGMWNCVFETCQFLFKDPKLYKFKINELFLDALYTDCVAVFKTMEEAEYAKKTWTEFHGHGTEDIHFMSIEQI